MHADRYRAVFVASRRTLGLSLLMTLMIFADRTTTAQIAAESDAADKPSPTAAEQAGVALQSDGLTEASGMAISYRRPNRFWMHNDSGDDAVMYAVDAAGRGTGRWQVQQADAVDWEDIASFMLDGQPHLLIADVGDNTGTRRSVVLYLVAEPDPNATGGVPVRRRIELTYPDGPGDCEAVAVDQATRQIVLVAKTAWPAATVYTLPLEAPTTDGRPLVAQRLTQVPMPMVTAVDIRKSDGAILLAGYFDGFIYSRGSGDRSLADVLGGRPRHIAWPRLRQIEGACFDRGGNIWVCSEGSPGRMARVE